MNPCPSLCYRQPGCCLLPAVCLALVSLPLPSPAAASSPPPNVLVLSSYHLGYTWSDDIIAGIRDAFAEAGQPDEALPRRVRREWSAAVTEARARRAEIRPLVYPVTCKGRRVRQVEFRMKATEDLNVLMYTDVTERKQPEDERERLMGQLAQSQKMEAVGRLAGGVAHDFNNMLGVILGHTELALGQRGPAQPVYASLEVVRRAAGRSADSTRQLLAFARKQIVSPRVLDEGVCFLQKPFSLRELADKVREALRIS